MDTPTLLLLGSESGSFFKDATKTLERSLLNARTVVMPGQGHAAMDTAPEVFLDEVIKFLTEK